jgi:hypothetical protein
MAILGLALEQAQAKDARAAEIAAALERSAEQDQEQAWWTATRDQCWISPKTRPPKPRPTR